MPDTSNIAAAVEQAVLAMRADLFCGAGIADIASRTFYSKFHFTREFSRLVGTTPRRFLAALRMERASTMLLTTDLSIADAGTMVGYSSVGTFSTRFSALVGVSPRQWRACGGRPGAIDRVEGTATGQLRGQVDLGAAAETADCDVFVGAFEDSIVQGRPVAATRLDGPGAFHLDGLPPGEWTVVVLARVAHRGPGAHVEWLRADARMTAYADSSTSQLPVRLRMRSARPCDPPVLLGGTHADPAGPPPVRRNREYPLDMVLGQVGGVAPAPGGTPGR
ncbi:helix-turn-helix transcriptional regulator [Isoptericola sp. 178]|uniref:helix-turn-helix transcriptional regulator n=1 Tax=Isoptericola sp. 178 TaxID=3064651 RepID=UPI0027142E68|nr:helix-turn-helix transcriptional regulator [Isoptericola sp. 178]MDO8145903.1 helix-turn-helix transcriptional regulator [Isoptericola sp. 178]